MPSRARDFTCFCETCKEAGPLGRDGEPLGVVFPISQRISHLARVKAERNARGESLPIPPIHSTAEITTAALVDSMLDEIPSYSQLDRLWTSRDDYQDKAYVPEISNTISGEVLDAMAESFGRLAIEPSINDLIGPMEGLSVCPGINPVSPLPCSNGGSSTTRSPNCTRRETKRERSAYTKKAHLTLNHVEHGAHSCLTALSNVESNPELEPIKREIALLRHSFDNVTRKVPSVDARKRTLGGLLSQVDHMFQELQAAYPASAVGPIVYDTGHHFELPVNSHNPVAQLTMFIAVVCTVIMGLSRQMGNLVLNLVKLTLRWALQDSKGNLTERQSSILNQIPTTVETILSKFNLDGKTTVFATCPECHCTYSPSFHPGSHIPSYPATCSNRPYPEAEVCGSRLLEEVITDDGVSSSKPLKPFVVYDFHDYLASLLAQKDLEDLMDKCCDDLTASIKKSEPPPDYISDVFQGEFIRTFEGPTSGRLFVDRPGKEGRYVFALNVDFFNSEGMTVRGASTSSGVICAACLNLPLEIRYKPENMYLAGVIPGPKEPRLTELNHYIRPVVDQFSVSWDRGVRFTRTANHTNGRDTRSAIAIAVCDLPAARKVNQSAGHSSHFYCSRCSCFHRSTCGRTDYNRWCLQDRSLLRQYAEAWKNAPSRKDQDDLFAKHGIRWTELWRLPYWDPPRMLVVDSMHCLLEGLSQFHFREVLKLTNRVAETKPEIPNAFDYDFPAPSSTKRITRAKMSELEIKQVSQIQNLLLAPLPDNTAEAHTSFVKALERRNKNPLVYVAESLGLSPDHQPSQPPSFTKLHWARSLAAWRFTFPLSCPNKLPPRISTPEVMNRIREVIRDMATPSWISSVPHNFGDAAAGTLKADEWRTITTIYLPVALISLWGKGTAQVSQSTAAQLKQILDHTMDLVSAVSLACTRTTTESRMNAYRFHLSSWVSGLKILHPDVEHRVNNHMAFHIYDFLRLFGPVRSWWCFPFERLIGQLQRLPHNHKRGQLESTMTLSYLKAGRLKQWLGRPDCPAFLRECKALFDKAFRTKSDNPCPAASAFGPVPQHLKAITHGTKIALRATHIINGIVYSRCSTHIGNSLVMFYPGGDRSLSPVPGSIQHIVTYTNQDVVYVVQRQGSTTPDQPDPYTDYPHFPAQIYSNSLSSDLEIVCPDWVLCHYARWAMDKDRAVVLILSRD